MCPTTYWARLVVVVVLFVLLGLAAETRLAALLSLGLRLGLSLGLELVLVLVLLFLLQLELAIPIVVTTTTSAAAVFSAPALAASGADPLVLVARHGALANRVRLDVVEVDLARAAPRARSHDTLVAVLVVVRRAVIVGTRNTLCRPVR